MYNVEDPKDLTEALSSVDANLWQEAINDEMDSLEPNRTWHLVNLPLNMDVKTAFLNGDLEEEIYMEQSEGFIVHGQESKVCKLDKSLYGLKQAPKQWHEKFDNLLLSKGFKVNESDECIYYKPEDQSHYIEKILKKYNYFDSKPTCTPYDSSVKLFKNTGDSVNQSEYAGIIGSLRYAVDCTRPDIAYAVRLLCRFTSRPSLEHWNTIERIIRYLKKTQNLGLHYNKFPAVLEGYSDADWNSLSDNSKAISGYIFNIAGGAVAWKSKI
ncbi:retrotransposon protein, putative, Ty1-copia subclass [Cucumis melo var. makuwa]|uniref:Retrotransposon protein, putative, Ty1-copia subclass n=1 Tax=Cucumis melo var. makuwa TaxID=1194695 RepID=A0A5A7U9F8_CUCMM|nr:retrotransposon protein, putative, Ty1-copia subclass [Cucumis melo var. makuwa]